MMLPLQDEWCFGWIGQVLRIFKIEVSTPTDTPQKMWSLIVKLITHPNPIKQNMPEHRKVCTRDILPEEYYV